MQTGNKAWLETVAAAGIEAHLQFVATVRQGPALEP